MALYFIDYETFYSSEYSLRKMTPVEYILDPRFECMGAAIKQGIEGESYWLDGDELHKFFADLNPDNTALVSHNALFDACITSWRYNFQPLFTWDTLGIARAMLGHKLRSLSLANVARELGIGMKGDAVHKVIGMSAAAIKAAGLWDAYTEYARNDADLCAQIFKKLVTEGGFPKRELRIMDLVIRCATQPSMLLDANVLAEHLHKIQSEKETLLTQAMMMGAEGKADLMSNDKFAELLRSVGVEPPRKISKLTGRETYAFARTDPDFMALEEHENPAVQALFAARMGHKSTLEETRTERFLKMSQLQWPDGKPARAPMPLRYSGAHTHRLSGDWSLNVQNMPRGGALRRSLIAPPDHKIVAADLSQIEARLVAWFCKQDDLVEQFANGEDVYSSFASTVFGYPVSKANKAERFIGKTAILGMGYGVGWSNFQRTVKLQSAAQAGTTIELDDLEAQRIVNTYRTTYSNIPRMWRTLDGLIPSLVQGDSGQKLGPVTLRSNAIDLPSGLQLKYHNLQYDNERRGWTYEYGGKTKSLYGGAMLENVIQALARIVVMDAAVRLQTVIENVGGRLALQVHDELVFVIPNDLAEKARDVIMREMTREVEWAPGLPIAAEADIGPSYGDAK